MLRIMCVTWIILSLFSGTGYAGGDLTSALEGIRAKYGNLPGLSLDYEREVITRTMTLLGDQTRGDLATGRMYFQPPFFLKLEQQTPNAEILVSEESTLWWFIADQKRVYKYSAEEFGKELRLLSDIFRGLKEVEDRFRVALSTPKDRKGSEIELRPITPMQNMDRILVTVADDYTIQAVSIYYQLGSVTLFTLKNIQSKDDFGEGFFKFVVPEGCILIDETQTTIPGNQ